MIFLLYRLSFEKATYIPAGAVAARTLKLKSAVNTLRGHILTDGKRIWAWYKEYSKDVAFGEEKVFTIEDRQKKSVGWTLEVIGLSDYFEVEDGLNYTAEDASPSLNSTGVGEAKETTDSADRKEQKITAFTSGRISQKAFLRLDDIHLVLAFFNSFCRTCTW